MKKIVIIELTEDQAKVVKYALDLYSRIGIGQIEEVERVLQRQFGFFEVVGKNTKIYWDGINQAIAVAKQYLGFDKNASYGIGNKNVAVNVKRAYEIQKVIEKTLAVDNNPNPSFKGVDYDGLIVRYTNDPEPVCKIVKK